ncbi:MAG TPA: hypothetical protein VF223_18570 [Trebonia sp.]
MTADPDSEKIIDRAVRRGVVSASRADDYRAAASRGEDVTVLDRMGALDPDVAAAIGMKDPAVRAAGPVYRQAAPPNTDPTLFSSNPLHDELRQSRPALVAAAERDNPDVPRLFGDRDLPPFCASGLDPAILATLPWPLRRPVAAMPNLTAAFNLVEKYSGEPEMTRELITSRHNTDYIERFSLWLQGPGHPESNANPPQGIGASERNGDYTVERLHSEIFGSPPKKGYPTWPR